MTVKDGAIRCLSITMRFLNRIAAYLPLIFFILLFGGLAWLLWQAWQGVVQNPFVSAAASFVLVAVTVYYAWQLRKSADRTAETLDEMKKDRAKRGKVLPLPSVSIRF